MERLVLSNAMKAYVHTVAKVLKQEEQDEEEVKMAKPVYEMLFNQAITSVEDGLKLLKKATWADKKEKDIAVYLTNRALSYRKEIKQKDPT